MVFLRLFIAGLILCVLWRPRRQALKSAKGAWKTVLAAGTLLAGHHIAFFEAVNHIPLGIVASIARAGSGLLDPHVLWVAAVVAVVSSVLPYSLNLEALRRIPPRVFGVLTSLEPAAGALFGLLVLGQRLDRSQWLGIAAVACASIAATYLGPGKRRISRVRATSGSLPEEGSARNGAGIPRAPGKATVHSPDRSSGTSKMFMSRVRDMMQTRGPRCVVRGGW
ncbi:EamA family transporter [Streptomyces sp. C10]|uniref:EamA family transporter n=1 Tax=Streptomyces sp. C10 TaxID=531941 RepID=UPI00398041D3